MKNKVYKKKIEFTGDDKIKMNMELILSQITKADLYPIDVSEYREEAKKCLFLSYKLIKQTLQLLEVDLDEK